MSIRLTTRFGALGDLVVLYNGRETEIELRKFTANASKARLCLRLFLRWSSFNTCVRFRHDQTKPTNMTSQTPIDINGDDVDLWTNSDDSDSDHEADDRSWPSSDGAEPEVSVKIERVKVEEEATMIEEDIHTEELSQRAQPLAIPATAQAQIDLAIMEQELVIQEKKLALLKAKQVVEVSNNDSSEASEDIPTLDQPRHTPTPTCTTQPRQQGFRARKSSEEGDNHKNKAARCAIDYMEALLADHAMDNCAMLKIKCSMKQLKEMDRTLYFDTIGKMRSFGSGGTDTDLSSEVWDETRCCKQLTQTMKSRSANLIRKPYVVDPVAVPPVVMPAIGGGVNKTNLKKLGNYREMRIQVGKQRDSDIIDIAPKPNNNSAQRPPTNERSVTLKKKKKAKPTAEELRAPNGDAAKQLASVLDASPKEKASQPKSSPKKKASQPKSSPTPKKQAVGTPQKPGKKMMSNKAVKAAKSALKLELSPPPVRSSGSLSRNNSSQAIIQTFISKGECKSGQGVDADILVKGSKIMVNMLYDDGQFEYVNATVEEAKITPVFSLKESGKEYTARIYKLEYHDDDSIHTVNLTSKDLHQRASEPRAGLFKSLKQQVWKHGHNLSLSPYMQMSP